ncbi:gamma-glutamyl hydrolase A-like isoform X2 [Thrips palmi]|uniref:folate gamma-glutamyl hydrolase n=1 Tax=Thrips palmi TaxID=161013 RepID=A0A6P9A236_THRPL|nr:gamma-glutamyl hydrolase A-like isoform X2 [Thrips palmi]
MKTKLSSSSAGGLSSHRLSVATSALQIYREVVISTQSLADDNEVEVAVANNRPIVGILSQEIQNTSTVQKQYKSFISASYVKFLEGAGARVVPIWINRTRPYYEYITSHINGVLFPGGSSDFNAKNGYADAGAIIYDIAKKLNAKGDYFPLWGTCLGLELLAYLGANKTNPLTLCQSGNVNLNLDLLSGYNRSKLFGSASKEIINILSNEKVLINFHRYCLTQENVTQFMGDINWRIMSTNKDSNGLKFVSTIESRNFPAYGVQFHPEKSIFEWNPVQKTAHSSNAVKAAQYFANFFVNEARKSTHAFPSIAEETKALIYNFSPQYKGREKNYFNEQMYYFEW